MNIFIDRNKCLCFNSVMTLTDSDFKALKELMEVTFDERLEIKLDEKLDEKLSHLPSKDEFYEETAKILKKQDDLEIEKDILSNRVSEHSDELEKLKEIHPGFKHTSV